MARIAVYTAILRKAEKSFVLAEREGFEPSVPVTQYARLAIWCLRPLGHLSAPENQAPAVPLAVRIRPTVPSDFPRRKDGDRNPLARIEVANVCAQFSRS